MDFALSEPIPWKAKECFEAGTVHLGGTFEEIARSEREHGAGKISEKPFVLLAQHTLFDTTRAPEGKHTAWAYCHVPNGATADMTGAIENQIERFAPGFQRLHHRQINNVACRSSTSQRQQHRRRHQRRRGNSLPTFHTPGRQNKSLRHPVKRSLYLFVFNASGRRRSRNVRLPRGKNRFGKRIRKEDLERKIKKVKSEDQTTDKNSEPDYRKSIRIM